MINEAQKRLIEFQPKHDFFLGVDSDGCVFDSMSIKQSECFCPWMIGYFGLQPVARAARECRMYSVLYSRERGANRYLALKRILTELLPSHPMVKKIGFKVPSYPHYFAWVEDPKSVLSNAGLKQAIENTENPEARRELQLVLDWSERVNWAVREIVKELPVFPKVRESLEMASAKADIIVISSTPCEELEREWKANGIDVYPAVIAGQELGTKKELLKLATEGGRYGPNHVLMIGDAPGDLEAARANNALFYPINPGKEIKSWERFYLEAFDRFLAGTYAGDYEKSLIEEYEKLLSPVPPWMK